MASDTATAKAEAGASRRQRDQARLDLTRRLNRFGGSRLGGLIFILNLISLLILLGGALALNEMQRGLVEARQDSLMGQAELLSNFLADKEYTVGEPTPRFNIEKSPQLLRDVFIPQGQRARLYDADGVLTADSAGAISGGAADLLRPFADSYAVTEAIPGRPLPPARPAGTPVAAPTEQQQEKENGRQRRARAELYDEVTAALDGAPQKKVRHNEEGKRVVSVSLPVRHVNQILGVLTLEAGDVDEILAAQRRALTPFALVAFAVNILASLLLHLFVARPIMRLSAAADEVRMQRARAISLPDLEGRRDEIGDLAKSLETMTETLSDRMDAIEAFAADVSHEIKNPLTSIRSALETLPLVKTDEQRERLTNLLQADVKRLDRLITDISNASRLDAELSRDRPRPIDLNVLIHDIVSVYDANAKPGEASVVLTPEADEARVLGRDGPLGQVFRNLIDNARSFSPAGGDVRIFMTRQGPEPETIRIVVDDDGPGIPPDNLETVFKRFYTSRPKGAAFGSNSGLGLSIVQQIVEAHGGRVHAENRHAEDGSVLGARFVVELPVTHLAVVRRA
jgi:two-component system sensor histidine kinase ChvG